MAITQLHSDFPKIHNALFQTPIGPTLLLSLSSSDRSSNIGSLVQFFIIKILKLSSIHSTKTF
nr:MAG TPA: hypothetical protein [Caudoviricetes sp.]